MGCNASKSVMFIHFNDLKADMEGEMKKMSKFLEIDFPSVVRSGREVPAPSSTRGRTEDGLTY